MSKRHPECTTPPEDCRICVLDSVTTCLGWTPVYDGNGRLVNEDPNRTMTKYKCNTCGKTWTVRT